MSNDWCEKGELPPIGTECEYHHVKFGWKPVRIIGSHLDRVVFSIWDLPEDYADYIYMACNHKNLFRPLRTEHEIVRSGILDIIEANGNLSNGILADTLIEAGYRKIKPMSESQFIHHSSASVVIREIAVTSEQERVLQLFAQSLYRAGCRFIDKGESK